MPGPGGRITSPQFILSRVVIYRNEINFPEINRRYGSILYGFARTSIVSGRTVGRGKRVDSEIIIYIIILIIIMLVLHK